MAFPIKELLRLPEDNTKCESCHKNELSSALLIWANRYSTDVDGYYLCDHCYKFYKSMHGFFFSAMNWMSYIFRVSRGEE